VSIFFRSMFASAAHVRFVWASPWVVLTTFGVCSLGFATWASVSNLLVASSSSQTVRPTPALAVTRHHHPLRRSVSRVSWDDAGNYHSVSRPSTESPTHETRTPPQGRVGLSLMLAFGILTWHLAHRLLKTFLPRSRPSADPTQWMMAATSEGEDDSSDMFSFKQIQWLDSPDRGAPEQPAWEGELSLPLFPLGNVYLPGSKHVLNIFEPRYCELYSNVILNGSRRFVVPLVVHPGMTGDISMGEAIAKVGVIFYIDDFRKVDEETDGMLKYVCSHKVIGRANIRRIVNPSALHDTATYVRAVVEELTDSDQDVDLLDDELAASASFREVVELHQRLKDAEPVRFSGDMGAPGNLFSRGDDGTLWETATLWQSLFRERLGTLQMMRQQGEQALVKEWLKDRGIDITDLLGKNAQKAVIRIVDLPEPLQLRYKQLQADFMEQAKPLQSVYLWFFQALVQETSQAARLKLMGKVMDDELRRLRAKASLKAVFVD